MELEYIKARVQNNRGPGNKEFEERIKLLFLQNHY